MVVGAAVVVVGAAVVVVVGAAVVGVAVVSVVAAVEAVVSAAEADGSSEPLSAVVSSVAACALAPSAGAGVGRVRRASVVEVATISSEGAAVVDDVAAALDDVTSLPAAAVVVGSELEHAAATNKAPLANATPALMRRDASRVRELDLGLGAMALPVVRLCPGERDLHRDAGAARRERSGGTSARAGQRLSPGCEYR